MKRRTFLAAGLGAGVLTAGFTVWSAMPVIPKRPAPTPAGAKGWIRHVNGRFQLHLPRVEMGQNIATGLKQIACDELDVEWEQVELRLQKTLDMDRVRATVGSESIMAFGVPLAQACAALRDALAAGVSTGDLEVIERPISALKAFSKQRRYVGGSVPLEQVDDIIRGQAVYAADIRPDGMVYGRILRAPASAELASGPLSWNEDEARDVPGFVALANGDPLTQGNSRGLGIVAETPGALDRIQEALDVKWKIEGGFEQHDLDAFIDIDARLAKGGLRYQEASDEMGTNSAWDVDLRMDVPLAAHGAIEPRAAVAQLTAGGDLELWIGNQDVFYVRDEVANRLDISADRINVHSCRVGGAFGGKTICTVELEAAFLTQQVRQPVKVQWDRVREYRFGFHRPPSSHRIRARLKDGRLDAWHHAFASCHIIFTNAAMPAWMQVATNVFVGDPGVARGSALAYRANSVRTEFDLVRLPVHTGPWRGLGAGPNSLAIESAIDECAVVAGADPVTFRLDHLKDPRLARALTRVAEISGWENRPTAASGAMRRGWGVACGIYKGMSYAATVAEVEIADDGSVRMVNLWCTHDCGVVINPDQVRAQCEGNLVWGIGMVLTDQLPVTASKVDASHFGDAPIPTIDQVPPIIVDLIDTGEPPTGAGETAIVSAAGAVANAICNATGRRPDRLPLDADRLAMTNHD